MKKFGSVLCLAAFLAAMIPVYGANMCHGGQKCDERSAARIEDSTRPADPGKTYDLETLFLRKFTERNPEFYLSPGDVAQKVRKDKSLVLVDVRDSESFNQFRIPGSINIPLFAVKTKSFFKGRQVVLVNEGHGYSPLEQECEILRSLQFNAWILNGGLSYWKEMRGSLEGDIFAQEALNRVHSRDFFAEKEFDNWIVVSTDETGSEEAETLFRRVLYVPYSADNALFTATLDRAVRGFRNAPFRSILITNDSGNSYEEMEHAISGAGIRNVLFLEGGTLGYRAFVEQQAAIQQGKNRISQTNLNRGGCP